MNVSWLSLVLAISLSEAVGGASAGQVRPEFLAEADSTPRNLWTDPEIDRWRDAAEAYLGDSEYRDPVREEVLLRLVDWANLRKDQVRRRSVIDQYLAEFPGGRFIDEFEWEQAVMQNSAYEHNHEDAREAIGFADGFERFIADHPSSRKIDEARLRAGFEHHVAYEILYYFPETNIGRTDSDREEHRERARELWQLVVRGNDEEAAAQAARWLSLDFVYFLRPPRGEEELRRTDAILRHPVRLVVARCIGNCVGADSAACGA